MADQGRNENALPLFDLFDSSYMDDFTINFTSSSAAEGPILVPQSVGGNAMGGFDPLVVEDQILWNLNAFDEAAGPLRLCGGETSNRNFYAGPGEEGNAHPHQHHHPPQASTSSGFRNSFRMPIQPPPQAPVPFQCSFCQVLREIIHTNGNHAVKLEIHGRLGMICHAILENRHIQEYQMFDFCKESTESVKRFLVQYCEERRQAGYIMLQDPLLIFYEALCIGLDCDEDINNGDIIQFSPAGLDFSGPSDEFQPNEQVPEDQAERVPKTSLAMQRERAAKLTMRDVGKYFNVPIEEAARKVGVCPTVVKKICRKNGVYRWPHRKIKSIERKLSILMASLSSTDPEVRVRAQDGIERLKAKINDIYALVT